MSKARELCRSFLAWRERVARERRTIKELNRLSDYELHDIGIHRSMIPALARGDYQK